MRVKMRTKQHISITKNIIALQTFGSDNVSVKNRKVMRGREQIADDSNSFSDFQWYIDSEWNFTIKLMFLCQRSRI